MKFTTTKSDLLTAISRCVPVTDSKGTMPILSTVLLDASGGDLVISATDLFRSIQTRTDAAIDTCGTICLSGKDLLERIRSMPEGMIAFSAEGTKVTIKAVGSSRRYVMHGVPGDEFPKMPMLSDDKKASREFKTSQLTAMIGQAHHSISTDNTRQHLNALLVETDDKSTRMVSTDGHRLTVVSNGEPAESATKWLIPLSAVNDLRKLFDKTDCDVTLTEDRGSLFVAMPEFTFTVKLVDSSPVPWKQVVPESTKRTVTVNRAALADALRAVSVAATNKIGGMKFTFSKDKIRLESESPDAGEGFDEVVAEYDGDEITIGFNARYVMDAIGVLDSGDVVIGTSDELDPAVFRAAGNEAYMGVVMPCRV